MNGKTMATLLENTRCNTAYLRRHVKVVEMWECEWKEVRNESDVKTFLTPSSRPRWTMTQQQILAAVIDGTLFVIVECDVRVPEELQDYFFSKCSLCSRTRASLEMTSDRSFLTRRFNKIATQGAPQMAVDKEANSLSRVYSYYSKFNLCLFYV